VPSLCGQGSGTARGQGRLSALLDRFPPRPLRNGRLPPDSDATHSVHERPLVHELMRKASADLVSGPPWTPIFLFRAGEWSPGNHLALVQNPAVYHPDACTPRACPARDGPLAYAAILGSSSEGQDLRVGHRARVTGYRVCASGRGHPLRVPPFALSRSTAQFVEHQSDFVIPVAHGHLPNDLDILRCGRLFTARSGPSHFELGMGAALPMDHKAKDPCVVLVVAGRSSII
jgi:hypothetical protein